MLQVMRRLLPLSLALMVVLGLGPRAALAAGTPDFTIAASPSSVLISSNGSSGFGSTELTATSLNGFSGFVSFTVGGLPTGVTATVIPAPGPNIAELELNASGSATQGTTDITVTGTSGSLTHSIQVPVTVVLPVSDFGVAVSPTSASINAGSSGTFRVSGTPLTGFTGTVTFTASGLPAGVTASFSATTTSSNGASSATLTLAAASTAPASTSTVVVTGHAGSVTATAGIALTVVPGTGNGTGGVTVSPAINANSPWFDEDDVKLGNPTPLTALSVTIVIQRTPGVSFSGQYNTAGGQIVQSSSSTATAITYQFTLAPGQTLAAGTGRTFGAQASGSGTFHPTAGDSFTVTYTTGGVTFTQSGNYPEVDPI